MLLKLLNYGPAGKPRKITFYCSSKQGSSKVQKQGREGGKSIHCQGWAAGGRWPGQSAGSQCDQETTRSQHRTALEATRSEQERSAQGENFRPLVLALARQLSQKCPRAPGHLAWAQAGARQAGERPEGCSWTGSSKGPFVLPQ